MPDEFLLQSKTIVKNFLHTAVILDEEATFSTINRTTTPYQDDIPTRVNTPYGSDDNSTTLITLPPRLNENNEDNTHKLYVTDIIDTFTDHGIICSIIKPESEEEFNNRKESYVKLMKKADIIILDWNLFHDGGELIKNLISNSFVSSEDPVNNLNEFRLIIIYSANDLDIIKNGLKSIQINFAEGSYEATIENKLTHISLFNKPEILQPVSISRVIDFKNLVDTCITEFTNKFHGIVPNVAMAAVTAIRNNTHKLLGTLNKNLDIAYLSHRTLLDTPNEAEQHIEEIIAKEVTSIIFDSKIGKASSLEKLKHSPVVKNKKYQGISFVDCLTYGVERALKINSSTLNRSQKTKKTKFDKDVSECYSHIWYKSNKIEAQKSENLFAIVSSVSTNYSNTEKTLTSGVIIKKIPTNGESNSATLLCIQPRCDSVRLTGNVEFLFISLKPISGKDKINIILHEQNNQIKYKVDQRKKHIITFKASKTDKVVMSEKLKYKSNAADEYEFIASLTNEQTSRIIQNFSNFISRIGLNESEYLRRNGS